MKSRNLLLKIQYDGTRYHGYQIQPNVITVQGELESALSAITKESISVNGCSRTDAGVHAVEYACSFQTAFPIPAERLPIVLNNKLPDDIRALSCCEVSENFHARFDTKSKTYRYIINCDANPDLFTRNFEWQIKRELDVEKMNVAASMFIGEKDFRSFMTSGANVETTVRTIYSLEVKKKDNYICIYINANGYLYNMVRIITGTLYNVGIGKTTPEQVEEIINSKNRENAGPTAPPQGLALYKVEYQGDN